MPRESFVWCKRRKKLIPKDQYVPSYAPKSSGLQVIKDLDPYRSMVDGSIIGGRKQHRDHLRAHRVTEVGNEYVTNENKPKHTLGGLGEDIKRAFAQHGHGD